MSNNNNEILAISEILKDLGVSPSLLGYRYIRYAVGLLVEDMSLIHTICKELYPRVAEHFGTTPSRVERGVRNAIETGWLRGDEKLEQKLFGYTVSADRGKPTNGEFLATIADYLLMVMGG